MSGKSILFLYLFIYVENQYLLINRDNLEHMWHRGVGRMGQINTI